MCKRKLCPNCKTGKETYALDERSPECPYLSLHNGRKCSMYVKLDKSGNKRILKKIFELGRMFSSKD